MASLPPCRGYNPRIRPYIGTSISFAALFSTSPHTRIRTRTVAIRNRASRPSNTTPVYEDAAKPAKGNLDPNPEPRLSAHSQSHTSLVSVPVGLQTISKLPKLQAKSPQGMKPYQQSLYQEPSIWYSSAALPDLGKDTRPPLNAAAKFFDQRHQFLYSAATIYQHVRNDHIPEIVILGASNAGKSSFLNALLGRTDAAKVSHRPGKTATMNAYGVGPRPKISRHLVQKGDTPPKHSLILMDTPGYGFKSQMDWGQTIIKYLNVRQTLRGAVLLIPADKKLQDMDRWILKSLAKSRTRTLVVMTKADKAGSAWPDVCKDLALTIQSEMLDLGTPHYSSRDDGLDGSGTIFATAASMGISQRLGNGGGMGGVKLAILEMAGFSMRERVDRQPETEVYAGPVVPFDQLVWAK